MSAIPYAEVNRDLNRVATERASDLVASVTQLVDTPGEKFMLAWSVANTAIVQAAVFFAAHTGKDIEVDPFDLVQAMMSEIRAADTAPLPTSETSDVR